jgi:hypothetical protein
VSDKLFDSELVGRLTLQWKEAKSAAEKNRLILEIWRQSEGLCNWLISRIQFMPPHFDRDDWVSLLREKFWKLLPTYNPKRGTMYTLLFLGWRGAIATKLGQLSRGKTKEGAPIIAYESGLTWESGNSNNPRRESIEQLSGLERAEAEYCYKRDAYRNAIYDDTPDDGLEDF